MRGLTLAMCWLILVSGLAPAATKAADKSHNQLQGTWTAIKAERDGKAADDVVGHRISFTRNRFQINSKDGKRLHTGIVRVNPKAKPAAIDFEHTGGVVRKKVWNGIYKLDGDTLIICDNGPNLKKARPTAFSAKSGSGYILITFKRTKP